MLQAIARLLYLRGDLSREQREDLMLYDVSEHGGAVPRSAFDMIDDRPVGTAADLVAAGVARVIGFADDGTRFVFGNVSDPSGAWGFIFVVRVLPIIIFFASFMAVLYHLLVGREKA